MSERNQRALATLEGFSQHWAATDEVKLAYVPKLLLVNKRVILLRLSCFSSKHTILSTHLVWAPCSSQINV